MNKINRWKKIKYKGAGEIYEDIYENIIYAIFNMNSSGIENNEKLRLQLGKTRNDALKELSKIKRKQILILVKLNIVGKTVFTYYPTSHILNRDFSSRTSIWISSKSPILDSYKNETIEVGSELNGQVNTISFTESNFDEAIEKILSTLPKLGVVHNDSEININDFENLLNYLKRNEMHNELIGYVGEYIFYNLAKDKDIKIYDNHIKKILWNHENGNKYENHDFVVLLENMKNNFIEVKTTTQLSNRHYISKNELSFMEENKNSYSLISIKLNSIFMKLLYNDNEITLNAINSLIKKDNYVIEVFDGKDKINKTFNIEGKTFILEKR